MAKVLVVTDSKGVVTPREVKDSLEKDGYTVTIVDDIRYGFELNEQWDAYIVWIDSLSRSHYVVRDIRKKKSAETAHVSIAVWQPSALALGSGVSVIHNTDYFNTAVYNMIFEEKEVRKKKED